MRPSRHRKRPLRPCDVKDIVQLSLGAGGGGTVRICMRSKKDLQTLRDKSLTCGSCM